MKVRFLKLSAGPSGCHHPGEIVDLDDDHAADLFAAGAAVPVETATLRAPERAVPADEIETATVSAPETAAGRRARKPRA